MKEVVIVSVARTPIGSFLGSLSKIPATKLGGMAIEGALQKINLSKNLVDEVFLGNVLSAGLGQAPAKQSALFAGIPNTTPCTTINKVCASGMKAIQIATQSIALGDAEVVIAGGMENMSMTPHYIQSRIGKKFGKTIVEDGMQKDGLTDAYDDVSMGVFADACAKKYNISRKAQDEYAIQSYKKTKNAWSLGKFDNEITPVKLTQKPEAPAIFFEDEEFKKVDFNKIPKLKPAFTKEGSVTAANSSTINDGAAALVLMSLQKAKILNLKPLAKIISYADAANKPKWFTTAPEKAIRKALNKVKINIKDVDFFEINEAFSVVSLANMKLLKLKQHNVNVNGGSVAIGHPLGVSGARIVISLLSVLQQNNGKIGVAAICNGGGGASALVLETL